MNAFEAIPTCAVSSGGGLRRLDADASPVRTPAPQSPADVVGRFASQRHPRFPNRWQPVG